MLTATAEPRVVPEVIGVDPLLKVNQAAGLLALGKSKVYELMDAGRLRNVRIDGSRRIPRSAVVEFLDGLQSGGAEQRMQEPRRTGQEGRGSKGDTAHGW